MDSYKHNFQTQRDACFSIREIHVNVFKKYPVSNNKYIKYMIPNSKYTVQNTKYPVPSTKYTVLNTY